MSDTLAMLRWQDLLDIGIIAFLIYQVLQLIRGTRSASMLIGLLFMCLVYLGSRHLGLFTVSWVFDRFLDSILVVLVIIFQHDVRRMLTRVGQGAIFHRWSRVEQSQMIEEIVRAAAGLVRRKLGAIIVIQRDVGLADFVEVGTRVDSPVGRELLQSVFSPESPLHDGAVIIAGNRIEAARCVLPLTTNPSVAKTLGTRHRAAIGLTEETDAIAIVVSEEDHHISMVTEGHIARGLDTTTLRTSLTEMLTS